MSALVDWSDVGQIFVESLVAGVVIVAVFALGARLVTLGGERRSGAVPMIGAAVCFVIVLAAVGYGIYFTVDK